MLSVTWFRLSFTLNESYSLERQDNLIEITYMSVKWRYFFEKCKVIKSTHENRILFNIKTQPCVSIEQGLVCT